MSWLSKLKQGLSKTSSGISEGISDIFTKRKLDDEALEELEELLIAADVGAKVAADIVAEFSKGRFDKEIAPEEVKEALAEQIAAKLAPVAVPLTIARHSERGDASEESGSLVGTLSLARDDGASAPHVILVVGVNGNGKTTTIGKLAAQLTRGEAGGGKREAEPDHSHEPAKAARPNLLRSAAEQKFGGKKVMLGAVDTFRAAAVQQLQQWGERTGCEVITGADQADPASVAYQALERAKAEGADVLMIDTAGRLHNKANLMEELKKIVRVLQKLDDTAPHTVLQVLDATTGQNALSQVEAFRELIDVSGLIVTKLDGTAKAGVVVALADRFGLPIHAVGVGESVEDLKPFDAGEFAGSLVGA